MGSSRASAAWRRYETSWLILSIHCSRSLWGADHSRAGSQPAVELQMIIARCLRLVENTPLICQRLIPSGTFHSNVSPTRYPNIAVPMGPGQKSWTGPRRPRWETPGYTPSLPPYRGRPIHPGIHGDDVGGTSVGRPLCRATIRLPGSPGTRYDGLIAWPQRSDPGRRFMSYPLYRSCVHPLARSFLSGLRCVIRRIPIG